MYKEGVSLNFSDGYIDPEEMMNDGSYPPTYPNNEPLLDPDDSYQQKDQLLRSVEETHFLIKNILLSLCFGLDISNYDNSIRNFRFRIFKFHKDDENPRIS